jgi:hypothetical protein
MDWSKYLVNKLKHSGSHLKNNFFYLIYRLE